MDKSGSGVTIERELAREQERLHALQDIGTALGSTLDLNQLLTLILDRMSRLLGADRSTLYLVDDHTGELWSKVAQGERIHEIRLKPGEGLAGWVASTGRVLNIVDVYQDPRFEAEWDRRTGYRTRSTLCVPLRNPHRRIIGVVQVLNKREGSFDESDEALLQALAAQAAVSIENSKLFQSVVGKNMELLETKEELERRVRELDVLFEIAQVSASAVVLDDLLEGVLARAMRAVGAQAAAILMTEGEGGGELRFRSRHNVDPGAVQRVRIEQGEGICGWVAQHGRLQIVNDLVHDARYSPRLKEALGYDARSVLCVPLVWDDGAGALELLDKSKGIQDFTEDDARLVTMIAGHISTAIGLARGRQEREKQERLSAIGQFLSSVLHDLRTPMTVIGGYVRLMASEQEEQERERYAKKVERQVELIDAMTTETLAYARGDRKLWVRKVYLRQFFDDVKQQLAPDLADRNMSLSIELSDTGVSHFDAHKVLRAIHNLARNAVEARPHDAQRGHFNIMIGKDKGDLVLRFQDDGPGVPEPIQRRLFAPFTSFGKASGSGLGLAIVRTIAEDHGGSIELQSEPGKTEFTLRLPDAVQAVSAENDESNTQIPTKRG